MRYSTSDICMIYERKYRRQLSNIAVHRKLRLKYAMWSITSMLPIYTRASIYTVPGISLLFGSRRRLGEGLFTVKVAARCEGNFAAPLSYEQPDRSFRKPLAFASPPNFVLKLGTMFNLVYNAILSCFSY